MNKRMISAIFTVLTLVFITVGLVGSWYSVHSKYSGTGFMSMESESNADVFLTKMEGSSSGMGGASLKQTIDLSELKEQYETAGMDTSFLDAISNTLILTIITLISAIVALVFIVLSMYKEEFQKIGRILALAVSVFSLLAVIVFMTGFSSFVESQAASYGSQTGEIGFW